VKTFLSYALSLGGLGFVIAAIVGAAAVNISYPGARIQLIQMIQQSLNKAELMCKARKGTFFEPIGAAIKIGAMAQSTDIAIVATATRPSYDASVMPVTLHWKTLFGRGKKGVLLVVAGLAIAIAAKTSPILHIIIVVITGIATGWFLYTRAENLRSLMLARADILPYVDQAFADNKYVRYG
jgi:hypothetical protein